ncbi:MAG: hypothetical protein KDE59_30825 [Anaerolineales bacterium]|nr:hypothetical protein [Anaerolineales bacterium]MCB0031753.1 hypothetical protein [Anaerolineales bacterium]
MNKFYQKLTATSESHDAYWHNLVSLTGLELANLAVLDAKKSWSNWWAAQ